MPKPQQLVIGDLLNQKQSGAYFTPHDVVETLVRWAVRKPSDRLIDPSCGDGRFLAAHKKSVGIEQDARSAAEAIRRAPWALVHEGDFFSWAANTTERFECAAGNPPFIRYHSFNGEVRKKALALCRKAGASFSGLSSSWAPFLVVAARLLKPGGRMAFVVPAEIGHAPYAAPVLEYLVKNFSRVQVVAIRGKLFHDLSEDCWLLYADGFGGASSLIDLSVVDSFVPSVEVPACTLSISVTELRNCWKMRLRPFLLPQSVRDLYLLASSHPGSFRFKDVAKIGIGYVTGANDFFHLRPSLAERLSIPQAFLCPTVRSGRFLPSGSVTDSLVSEWRKADEQMLLLRLPKIGELPSAVKSYLDTEGGREAREAYKCRERAPWYSVPDVKTPDFFLAYMSGVNPALVRNSAGCTCTNSVHSVQFLRKEDGQLVKQQWSHPFVQLSCELEGHPLGGGMLKLEPREAGQILLPAPGLNTALHQADLLGSLSTMRSWRHYGAN